METDHIKLINFYESNTAWIGEVLGEDEKEITMTKLVPMRFVPTPKGLALGMGYNIPLVSPDPLYAQVKTFSKNNLLVVDCTNLTDSDQIVANYIKITTGLDIAEKVPEPSRIITSSR
jgi:hypothetical protein